MDLGAGLEFNIEADRKRESQTEDSGKQTEAAGRFAGMQDVLGNSELVQMDSGRGEEAPRSKGSHEVHV